MPCCVASSWILASSSGESGDEGIFPRNVVENGGVPLQAFFTGGQQKLFCDLFPVLIPPVGLFGLAVEIWNLQCCHDLLFQAVAQIECDQSFVGGERRYDEWNGSSALTMCGSSSSG